MNPFKKGDIAIRLGEFYKIYSANNNSVKVNWGFPNNLDDKYSTIWYGNFDYISPLLQEIIKSYGKEIH